MCAYGWEILPCPMSWLKHTFLLYHKALIIFPLQLCDVPIPFPSLHVDFCILSWSPWIHHLITDLPSWPSWLLAKHLKTAFSKRLQNVTYTHKYMQCSSPILFYFGSENDYLNKEKISTTSGLLNNKHCWNHSVGMLAHLEEERNHSFTFRHLFFFFNSFFRKYLHRHKNGSKAKAR